MLKPSHAQADEIFHGKVLNITRHTNHVHGWKINYSC